MRQVERWPQSIRWWENVIFCGLLFAFAAGGTLVLGDWIWPRHHNQPFWWTAGCASFLAYVYGRWYERRMRCARATA